MASLSTHVVPTTRSLVTFTLSGLFSLAMLAGCGGSEPTLARPADPKASTPTSPPTDKAGASKKVVTTDEDTSHSIRRANQKKN